MSSLNQPSCCAPVRQGVRQPELIQGPGKAVAAPGRPDVSGIEQALIPAGRFTMGDSRGDGNRADGEDPVHRVQLDGYSIDTTSVTVADFDRFVAATGYRTDAEQYGSSAVFKMKTLLWRR